MIEIDDAVLSYSQELETQRDKRMDTFKKMSQQLVNCIMDDDELDESEFNGINTRVNQIMSSRLVCRSLTGFVPEEIEKLVAISEGCFIISGKGRRIRLKPIDFIVILLHYLRCYPSFERGAFLFNLKTSTYEKYVKTAYEAVRDLYYQNFVVNPAEHFELPVSDEFPEASYVVDATVQKIYTPLGPFLNAKPYFSGKHYCYCLKSQVICDAKGAALHVVAGIPGATHDLAIFRDNMESFQNSIVKVHTNSGPKILADKGYISSEFSDVLITPFKGMPYDLSPQQNEHNQELASARVVVERFFGRLKNRWDIMKAEYRGNRDEYQNIFKLCVALTNFEIREFDYPLSEEDSFFYQRLIADMIYIEKLSYEDHLELRRQQRQRRLLKITNKV